ncbi:S9 family peptidase [Kordiimonas aestuarii]|uniref:S9 family peptidase n=1 Tax=Kordiimonas aestuarii TaxID=1005925 RepID=UPI0021D32907|nr:S9 family peptidase [Kordiimonas aestuarii]
MHYRIIFSALFAAVISYSGHAADPGSLSAADAVKLQYTSDPRLSPDGKWVAYTVSRNDLEKDKRRTQVWIAATDGTAELAMSGKGYCASSPRWSPDGKYLAFLAEKKEGEKSQVWLLDRRGGEARQYTHIKQGVDAFAWSPNGEEMLLTLTDLQPEPEKIDGEDKPMPWVIDRLQFKEDGVGYLDRYRQHLYLFSGEGSPTQITFGDYDDQSPAWSPDGKWIAFTSNRTEEPDSNTNSDIWVVSATLEDGKAATAENHPLRRVTSNPGADYSPAWSPDGKWIAYVSTVDTAKIWYATNHLAISPAAGGEARLLTTDYDRPVHAPRYAPDGRSIYVVSEDDGQMPLIAVDTKSGKVKRVTEDQSSTYAFDMNGDGMTVLNRSEPDQPDAIYTLKKGKLQRLSHLNDKLLASVNLASVREVQFPSADGTMIEAFIYLPPGYEQGKRYPAILRPHGGPVAQHDSGFYTEAQVLAAAGYVVIAPNPRGSTGYGEDFSAILFANWGVKDFEDVMAAVDFAIAEGYADPDKLGVGGWSYGGILTNYVITKSTRFKAAISGASEVLYRANYGHDIYQAIWEQELGLPWETPEAWERISPFNDIGKVTTPTLVIGGKEDWNVPIQNSEQLYQGLRRRGIETLLVVYPGETHSIVRPSFVLDRYQRYISWYDRFLK